MGRATLTVLLLLALSLAHAASTPNTPPPARALSDAQVGGIVVGSLAFLGLGVCWCAWCTQAHETNEAFAHSQTCGSCAGLGGACML